MTPGPRMQGWRITLTVAGLVLLLIAAVTLLNDVPPERYVGIGVWLVAALVIHDGIAAMIVFAVAVLLRRAGRRIPFVVIAILQAAIVVAVIVTAVVGPEIVKKAVGTANPSILPLDYLANLALFYVSLTVCTGLAIAIALFARRRVGRAVSVPDRAETGISTARRD